MAGPGLRPARLLSLRLRLPSVPAEEQRPRLARRQSPKGARAKGVAVERAPAPTTAVSESQNTREYERWKADHARMLAAEEAQRRAESRLQEVEGELWAHENSNEELVARSKRIFHYELPRPSKVLPFGIGTYSILI